MKENKEITKVYSKKQLEIIEAASKILSENGIQSLTIKNISNEVKVTESAIYRHFKSKDEIIISLLEYLIVSMENRLIEVISKENTPIDKFKKLFQSQFEFFSNHQYYIVSVFSDGLLEEKNKVHSLIIELMEIMSNFIRQIIEEGQKESIFTQKITEAELTQIVLGTFRLLMYKWRLSYFEFDLISEGEKMILSILNLIQNEK